MIVLDTSILSLAFRRGHRQEDDSGPVVALRKLIADNVPVAVPGIVLQELLSGVRSDEQFRKLRTAMAGFPILLANETHHVRAAQISNVCRSQGVACSTTDALIAAISVESGGALFTSDVDFQRIAPLCGLQLAKPPPKAQ